MNSWWILNYARPLGPKPVVYKGSPPNQQIELVWSEETKSYLQDPWQEGHPQEFSSKFEALKYLKKSGYLLSEIEVVLEKKKLRSL